MDHADHVAFLAPAVPATGGTWADFGAGDGAFTLALRDLAGPEASIYAVDKDRRSLDSLRRNMGRRFPGTTLTLRDGDFTKPLPFAGLDGIVAANSLHFVSPERQAHVLAEWRGYLAPGGRLILVEYDANHGNRWVPFPVSFTRFAELAQGAGYSRVERLASRRARILGSMYSALAINPKLETVAR